MPKISLGKGASRIISAAVDSIFDKLKKRFLGPNYGPKQMRVHWHPDLSLPGLYATSTAEEGNTPDHQIATNLADIAEAYLDAHKESTKAQIQKAVLAFLQNAQAQGVDTNFSTVLSGQIYDVLGKTGEKVKQILESEGTTARNMGALDAITKVAAASGNSDPTVFFIGPNDAKTCKYCTEMFFRADGVTPKVYKLSEVSHGYYKKGDKYPSLSGCHPNCRHSLCYLGSGYGFTDQGRITFKTFSHDEHAAQMKKDEE